MGHILQARGKETRIGRAILAATMEFGSSNRSEVAQLMVVLTDGDSNDNEAYWSQAARYEVNRWGNVALDTCGIWLLKESA